MPIANTAFLRLTALLLIVGFLALAGIVGTTIWLVERTQVYFAEVVEAREARTATVELRNAMQDVETGQRGFLLTGDETYLEPYEAALPTIEDRFQRLTVVLAPYPEADAPMVVLRQQIDTKLAEIAQTIALARSGDMDGAIALVGTDEGKIAMEGARVFFDALIAAADERLNTGVVDQRGAATALRWVTIIGAVVIFAVVSGFAWTAMLYTRELARARQAVEEANQGLEERVRERTSDLGRANDEIQRFAYIVTHDLRAPLVNIMGFTSELETGVATLSNYMETAPDTGDMKFRDAKTAAVEDLPEAVNFIRAGTRKMDSLINAILKISRDGRRALKPEEIDLKELVEASSSAVHHQVADGGGEIEADIRVPFLVSDRFSLEQVLGNLFDNAVKYQQPDRVLTVNIRAREITGRRIEIEVEDNGRGIAASDHDRVFELFRRSGQQTQPGEGIGLAHVRTLVRSLGGDIALRSEFGVGTTFIVTLPRDLRHFIGSQSK